MIALSLPLAYADSDIEVMMNGEKLQMEQSPVISEGRTLLPLRNVFEIFGFEVKWDQSSQAITASRGSYRMTMKNGENLARVNGRMQFLDVPSRLINGRVYVPVRFVAETLGAEVTWNPGESRVEISTARLDEPVYFSDNILRDAFRKRLNKDSFTVRDVYYVTELDLSNEGFYKLDGIEAFSNLVSIDISKNNITFLSPISGIRSLKELNASNNSIADLTAIKGLNELEAVDVSWNKITDFSSLMDLKKLSKLRVGNNTGRDYSPLYFNRAQYSEMDIQSSDIEIPRYDTMKVRNSGSFVRPISGSVKWVQSSYVDSSRLTNKEIQDLRIAGPEAIRNHISTVPDALRYLQLNRDFIFTEKLTEVRESGNERKWSYPIDGMNTIRTNSGDHAALAHVFDYLLSSDYSETGYIVLLKGDEAPKVLNYFRKDESTKGEDKYGNDVYVNHPRYFILQYESFREGSANPAAIETGDVGELAKTKATSNLLMADSLKEYAEYIGKGSADMVLSIRNKRKEALSLSYASYDKLTKPSLENVIIFPKQLQENIEVLYSSDTASFQIGYADSNVPAPDFIKLPTFDYRLYTK